MRGVGAEGPTLCQPAVQHSYHTRAPLLRTRDSPQGALAAPVHLKIDKSKSMDEGVLKHAGLNWLDTEGSPVSDEPGTPGLRAVLSSPLRDLAKGLKGVQLPSANNLKVLSTPQLETELVSAEDDIGNEVDTKAVCGERAVEQAAPVAPSPLGLDIGWSSIPHPLKVARGGEDSHVIARIHGVTLLGVFDGVGGWAELGVDPAEYARRLGLLVETALVENPEILQNDQRPLITLLTKAFDVLDKEELAGSCTASLALLTADSKLHVLNVGDSGVFLSGVFFILRVLY